MTIRLEVYLVEAERRGFYSVDACQPQHDSDELFSIFV